MWPVSMVKDIILLEEIDLECSPEVYVESRSRWAHKPVNYSSPNSSLVADLMGSSSDIVSIFVT